jgi:hypothetical protein
MESTSINIRIDPVADAKERMAALKPFPVGLKKEFMRRYPEYDSTKGSNLFDNVIYLRSTDLKILSIIEILVLEMSNNESNS